ncbi:hypothetical protein [Agromyces sp. NBRC 114283]|uniref:hypothetical protein n=1 Tax=Agromyces sp. NBRC 114283 TaxID=2994521 RepID=UPI0024A55BFF|nr:hypothetical protein [Agromyces sp. NBRC 114283]GLU88920.1 hypothetical protein Agsp01_11750 [Agromyces sp. NBRC 114283]
MTEEAREAAIDRARRLAEHHGIKFWTDAMFEVIAAAEASYAAGVREGIRQAREAVVAVNGRGMDNYLGRALEAIDALEAEK